MRTALRTPRVLAGAIATALLASTLSAAGTLGAPSAVAEPNTLLSQGALTAASSSESGGLGPRFAVDGDRGTRWASAQTDNEWIRIDLGRSYALDHIALEWEAAYGAAFRLQVSPDGNAWTTVVTESAGTGGTEVYDIAATGRYVQLVGTARGTQYGYSLFEFQVFGDGEAGGPEDPPPFPDDEVTHHEFQANCEFSHFLPDDSIVYPNQPGRSHLHTFIGNRSTDAFTTPASLLANPASTCTVPQDKSAYWFPALTEGGVPVEPNIPLTVYYKSGIDDYTDVVPFPAGLQFVTGNMMATVDEFRTAPGAVEGWECGDISKSWEIPAHCPEGTQLNIRYQAPSCWDGMHLTPEESAHMGHGSHMAYPVAGQCPLTHPVAVPMLEFKIAWPVSGAATQAATAAAASHTRPALTRPPRRVRPWSRARARSSRRAPCRGVACTGRSRAGCTGGRR